jgi:glycosyltransferase involved in cell wall biosynthesis
VLRAPGEAEETLAVDYFSPSIRMGLQNAVALESAALLRSVHVDACVSPGKTASVLKCIAGPRTKNRVIEGIPMARIHMHPQLTVVSRIRQRLLLSGRDTSAVDRVLIQIYSAIARQCESEAVVGAQNGCLELFRGRAYRIMDQVSAPSCYGRALAAEEFSRFPGWAPDGVTRSRPWDRRVEAEWQAADLVWVPSHHLISISSTFGADPLKFRVIPYPINRPELTGTIREPRARQVLRVVFAGTLMLGKGVQYIYEALRKRPNLPVQMEFFGPVNLSPLGVRRLTEVGTVHGPVPRSELLKEFRNADVLLFPSLSEGSALVTLEATALGLPVVATEESGAPMSAMTIPSRSPEAIIAAIEMIADDPAQLERLSAAGLNEAAKRTTTVYGDSIVDSIKALIRSKQA